MPNTTNLNLVVTDDDSELFEDWRKNINAVDNSNAKKIDDFVGKFIGGKVNQYYRKKSGTKFDAVWESADTAPTQGSEKLLSSGGTFTAIKEAAEAVDTGKKFTIANSGEVTQELQPDVFYDFSGNLSALTLTLNSEVDGRENEYKGQFLAGATIPTVTLPVGVTWVGGNPTFEKNKTYQFSILNGVGVMVGV